jgi:hypothetical protein
MEVCFSLRSLLLSVLAFGFVAILSITVYGLVVEWLDRRYRRKGD